MTMSLSEDPQVLSMIANLPAKTGKSIDEWFAILRASGLENHGDMLKLLKSEHGMTHGYANTVALLFRQQAAGGPQAEDDLVASQYAGPKAALRPIYDQVLSAVWGFGDDVEIAPKKAYVSLRRNKQFAIVQPSTKTRVDLGLNLKDVTPTDRLTAGVIFSGMCNHLVRLSASQDIDDEVVAWLRQAYDQAG
jgi:hypothetical protein